MSVSPRDPSAQIDLLRSLAGRVAPASRIFAETLAESAPAGSPGSPGSPDPAERESDEPRGRAAAPPVPPLTDFVPRAVEWRRDGFRCRVVETAVPLDGSPTPEGCRCPAARFDAPTGAGLASALALVCRDPRMRDVDPERIAFLDTETTCLANGAGTLAFLVGVGRMKADRFVLRQYFLEDWAEEAGMIEAVAEDLRDADALASYNGRSFDAPLLVGRFRMNRRAPELPDVHFDMLHAARRLWRSRLPDCRLGTVEREILGIERESDVPSMLIPSIYFDYVRGVRPERILPVLDHHAQDILSLGALTAAMARLATDPDRAEFDRAADHAGMAALLDTAGRGEESADRLARASLAARDDAESFRLAMLLARRLVRLGRVGEAVEIWEARVRQARAPDRLDPLVELAKHHEHRTGNLDEAGRWTRLAIEIAECDRDVRIALGRNWGHGERTEKIERETRDELLKRLARIESKRARTRRAEGGRPRPEPRDGDVDDRDPGEI